MGSWIVTIRSILEFLAKAREAKEKLDEASKQMDTAAQALCNVWKGDAAQAFANEQKVLYNYCTSLSNVGEEYMAQLSAEARRRQEAEERITAAIKG